MHGTAIPNVEVTSSVHGNKRITLNSLSFLNSSDSDSDNDAAPPASAAAQTPHGGYNASPLTAAQSRLYRLNYAVAAASASAAIATIAASAQTAVDSKSVLQTPARKNAMPINKWQTTGAAPKTPKLNPKTGLPLPVQFLNQDSLKRRHPGIFAANLQTPAVENGNNNVVHKKKRKLDKNAIVEAGLNQELTFDSDNEQSNKENNSTATAATTATAAAPAQPVATLRLG